MGSRQLTADLWAEQLPDSRPAMSAWSRWEHAVTAIRSIIAGERAQAVSQVTWAGVHYNEGDGGSFWGDSSGSTMYTGAETLVPGSAANTIAETPKKKISGADFGSSHSGGAHMLFADGHVRFVSGGISVPLFQLLGNIADKQSIRGFDF